MVRNTMVIIHILAFARRCRFNASSITTIPKKIIPGFSLSYLLRIYVIQTTTWAKKIKGQEIRKLNLSIL